MKKFPNLKNKTKNYWKWTKYNYVGKDIIKKKPEKIYNKFNSIKT